MSNALKNSHLHLLQLLNSAVFQYSDSRKRDLLVIQLISALSYGQGKYTTTITELCVMAQAR